MEDLFTPLTFARGQEMPNRFLLSPMTTRQSNDDGTLSDEEFEWLIARARGGFGMTMTCALHVQAIGRGFAGQLGIFDDKHVAGLSRLAEALKRESSLAIAQIYHAGMRAPKELNGASPVCPSDNEATGAVGLTLAEVERVIEDFVVAARRAERAGFDGIELHGAHGYLIGQFLSPVVNCRTDRYGGSFENRSRLLQELVSGVRQSCGPQFNVGVRLSGELFDLRLAEMKELAQDLMLGGQIDYLDMSLLDVFKQPKEQEHQGKTILEHFTSLERGNTRLGAAGMLWDGEHITKAFAAGLDMVGIGRAAIVHHDLPMQMRADPNFHPVKLPVSQAYLAEQSVSPAFVDYLIELFPGIVTKSEEAAENASADMHSLVSSAS